MPVSVRKRSQNQKAGVIIALKLGSEYFVVRGDYQGKIRDWRCSEEWLSLPQTLILIMLDFLG